MFELCSVFYTMKKPPVIALQIYRLFLETYAYHLYGKTDCSSGKINGTVHSNGNFPEKSNTFQGITFFSV